MQSFVALTLRSSWSMPNSSSAADALFYSLYFNYYQRQVVLYKYTNTKQFFYSRFYQVWKMLVNLFSSSSFQVILMVAIPALDLANSSNLTLYQLFLLLTTDTDKYYKKLVLNYRTWAATVCFSKSGRKNGFSRIWFYSW